MQHELIADLPMQARAATGPGSAVQAQAGEGRIRPCSEDQPCLPGLEAGRLDRLFFAITLDDAAATEAMRYGSLPVRLGGIGGRIVDRARLHVELAGVSQSEGLSRETVAVALKVGGEIRAPAFSLSFDRLAYRGRGAPRSLVLRSGRPLAALVEFRSLLVEQMQAARIAPKGRFVPLVALCVDGGRMPPKLVRPIGWTATEFALIHQSVVEGRHVVLGRWPLSRQTGNAESRAEISRGSEASTLLESVYQAGLSAQRRKKKGLPAMTTTLYGFKSCDMVKNARKWLDANGVRHSFFDYRAEKLDPATVDGWFKRAGWETVFNRNSTTFKELPDAAKAGIDEKKAKAMIMAETNLIKRPVLDVDGKLYFGFKADTYAQAFAKAK